MTPCLSYSLSAAYLTVGAHHGTLRVERRPVRVPAKKRVPRGALQVHAKSTSSSRRWPAP